MVKLPYKYIAIEGNIGVGKTTFANQITQQAGAKLLLERFEENPFLKDFYKDLAKYAYQTESFFLKDRVKQLESFLKPSSQLLISDFSIYKSLIFSKITLDFQLQVEFEKQFEKILTETFKPDLIIHLNADPSQISKRIVSRGRVYERGIQEQYLIDIENQYHSYWNSLKGLNLLLIDLTNARFPYSKLETEKFLNYLKQTEIKGVKHLKWGIFIE
jgi:deoxyguanosine kinase